MKRSRLTAYGVGLMVSLAILPKLRASDYVVHSLGLTVELSRDGKVTGVTLGNKKVRWNGH